jgi:hypothetical protein
MILTLFALTQSGELMMLNENSLNFPFYRHFEKKNSLFIAIL